MITNRPSYQVLLAKDLVDILDVYNSVTYSAIQPLKSNTLLTIRDIPAIVSRAQLAPVRAEEYTNMAEVLTVANIDKAINALLPQISKATIRLTVNEHFDFFTFTNNGSGVVIDWGDGNITTVTGGSNKQATHTYATAGTYQINCFNPYITEFYIDHNTYANNANYLISVDRLWASIQKLNISSNNNLTHFTAINLVGCTDFTFTSNPIYNEAVDFSALGLCENFSFNLLPAFNKPLDFSPLTSCVSFSCVGNDILNSAINLSGLVLCEDLSLDTNLAFNQPIDISALVNLQTFSMANNTAFNKLIDITGLSQLNGLNLNGCALTVTIVNSMLVTAVTTGGFTTGSTINLAGQTPPAHPTGAGATAKTTLTTAGCTVTTD